MAEKKNTVIAIRSFNLQGQAFAGLSGKTTIVFRNSSGQRLSEPDLCTAIRDADGVIAGTESYNATVLSSAPRLQVISRVGIGIDNIDLEYAKKRGITILNTPLAPVNAVAEHTVALILSLFKKIPQYYDNLHKGDYSIQQGGLITGKTLGIVGLGRIGWKVATLMEVFGVKVVFFDPWMKDPVPNKWVRKDTLRDLLPDADIISLHTPPQPHNLPLLDNEVFSLCKHGVVIINTARESLIDEHALRNALDCGIVSGAGLDVVSSEPYHGPLLQYPQVIITPHVASNTVESRQQMEIDAVENMLNAFRI